MDKYFIEAKASRMKIKEALKIISEKNINQYVNEQLSYWLENTGVT